LVHTVEFRSLEKGKYNPEDTAATDEGVSGYRRRKSWKRKVKKIYRKCLACVRKGRKKNAMRLQDYSHQVDA
jgi:hypothetical protein